MIDKKIIRIASNTKFEVLRRFIPANLLQKNKLCGDILKLN